jgi:asparagine synthase (glutamine-hydrolysing)
MCGIYFSYNTDDNTASEYCKNRGPDETKELKINKCYMKFHRLAINDLSTDGSQPMINNGIYFMCNGEIYNHHELSIKYNIVLKSKSDCEIIGHLYHILGFKEMIKLLDGYFAIVLYDAEKDIVYAGKDRFGVRALYFGESSLESESEFDSKSKSKSYIFASLLKCIPQVNMNVHVFKPEHIWSSVNGYESYADDNKWTNINGYLTDINVITKRIYDDLYDAVKKRIQCDRKIGCFLSGGLDSSIVTMLVSKFSKNVDTFSIGLAGSPDLKYAKIVADYLGTNHHEVIVTEKEMLDAIPEVIYNIETYDITTIRASTPMYLLSKYIKNNTDIKVLFSGEMADELSGSYKYFKMCPDPESFQRESIRLLNDLCYFDLLRGDKSVSSNGLELRLPLSDKKFTDMYMTIDPSLKMSDLNVIDKEHQRIEKYLLRVAFKGQLPDSVLWRSKEAFSDGVSKNENSWYKIIQSHLEKLNIDKIDYTYLLPQSKEALYYRNLFESYFPNRHTICPYIWLPKWSNNTTDPSARTLLTF